MSVRCALSGIALKFKGRKSANDYFSFYECKLVMLLVSLKQIDGCKNCSFEVKLLEIFYK